MKIQFPLNSQIEIEDNLFLQCDEFYAGFWDDELHPDSLNHISRRPGSYANFTNYSNFEKIVHHIKKIDKKIFVTFNEHYYERYNYDLILVKIEKLISIGVDGFIVSDINLILMIKSMFPMCYLIASTGSHIMNTGAVSFYKRLGIRRIIFPRHLSIHSINVIVEKNNDIDFEIFIKNDNCINIDGFCTYVHGFLDNYSFGQLCQSIKYFPRNICFETYACGVCTLFALKHHKNLILKIVGRDKPLELLKKDIDLVSIALKLADTINNQDEFKKKVIDTYTKIYNRHCDFICYYE